MHAGIKLNVTGAFATGGVQYRSVIPTIGAHTQNELAKIEFTTLACVRSVVLGIQRIVGHLPLELLLNFARISMAFGVVCVAPARLAGLPPSPSSSAAVLAIS